MSQKVVVVRVDVQRQTLADYEAPREALQSTALVLMTRTYLVAGPQVSGLHVRDHCKRAPNFGWKGKQVQAVLFCCGYWEE